MNVSRLADRAARSVSVRLMVIMIIEEVMADPRVLRCHKLFLRHGVLQHSVSRWYPILDQELFERLRHELKPGDEVEITKRTEYTGDDIKSFVVDCHKVGTPAPA